MASSHRRILGALALNMAAGALASLAGCGADEPSRSSASAATRDGGTVSKDAGLGDDSNFFRDAGTVPGCVKVSAKETKCDGKDDDCNGIVDDVDVGQDGLCDCLNIAIVGNAGAFASSSLQKWLSERGTTVRRLQDGALTPLTEASLSGVDVVILDWLSRDYSSKEVEEFRRWFQKGHGFLTMSGYSDDYPASRPNAFLDLVGFSLSSSVTVGIAPDQEVKTFAAHPLGEGLRSVSFLGGCDVSTVKAAPAPAKQGTFATLAGKTVGTWYESGDATNSRAVVWGDEWISFDSEWSKFPDVPRLWSNMMRYLAPQCKVPPPVR